MVDTYVENKARLKQFLPYVPYRIDNSKVILYSLISQLVNSGVEQKILYRIFNQNGINITLTSQSNIRIIAQALNQYIQREFCVSVDTYSYIVVNEQKDKYVFDATQKSFIESEIVYTLDKEIFNFLPNTLFKEISFTKDGVVLNIEKEYTYNFYQKYLPGQKHSLNGEIYEIKDIIETDSEVEALVEACTDYKNNIYRQLRETLFDLKRQSCN
jgi:hypothetical protein